MEFMLLLENYMLGCGNGHTAFAMHACVGISNDQNTAARHERSIYV